MDCNPEICPQLTKEEGASLFGTVSNYVSKNPVNCT
jgi:hypothetical protein